MSIPHKEDIIPEVLQHPVLLPALVNQREVWNIHFKEDGLRLDFPNLKKQKCARRLCYIDRSDTSASSFAISMFAAERCSYGAMQLKE